MISFKSLLFSLFTFLFYFVSAQNNPLNVEQVAHIPIDSFQVSTNSWGSPNELSDIWGWVDEDGNEYAIVGTNQGTSIFDLSNPTNPQEVFFEQGMNSTWRDIKTYGDYAYITTEAQNGLLIIDLSPLPSSNDLTTYYYYGSSTGNWQSAHNLYIDDRGYAYIFGANRGNGGCIILDLTQDPTSPVEIGVVDDWYVHDGMVKEDTLYLGHITDGFFTIWDVSSPSNPTMLAQHGSVGNFCHNVWVSDDGDYLYTTDEITNGFIGEYNIDDLSNIELTDKIQTEPGNNVIPHNTHFLNDYIITSYYKSGIVVHDVSQKGNMLEVGSFDTSPDFSGDGFNGCWGVYPWLPSGLIIASDMEEGLYVLSPTYKRGAYLEGLVKDAATNQGINGVEVEILAINVTSSTTNFGEFKTGTLNSGTYDVVFSHPSYQNDTLYDVVMQNDSLTTISLLMYQMSPITFNIETIKSLDNSLLANVKVALENDDFSYSGITSSDGSFLINGLVPGEYQLNAALWGYLDFCDETISISGANPSISISLDQGYSDRFNLDMGWEVNSSAFSGKWIRDIPLSTTYNNTICNPGDDSFDCGGKAYITGNAGGSATADDVDLGYTELISPVISLAGDEDYYLHCSLWWKNLGDDSPDDSLHILITDVNNEELLLTATYDNDFEWKDTVFLLPTTIDLSSFNIKVVTADGFSGVEHLVEAGFDNFLITNSPNNETSIIQSLNNGLTIYPNPTLDGIVNILDFEEFISYELYTISGKLIQQGLSNSFRIDKQGVYVLKVNQRVGNSMVKKIIF
jgi:choice-of-anchor B domain-containing protein